MLSGGRIVRELLLYVCQIFVLFFLLNLQSTVWFEFFGHFAPPLFWLPFFSYVTIYNSNNKKFVWLVTTYLSLLAHSSALPLPLLLTLTLLLLCSTFLQRRFSTLSASDFIYITGTGSLIFPFGYFVISALTAWPNTLSLLDCLVSCVLTAPMSILVLYFMKSLDRWILGQTLIELQAGYETPY